MKSKVGGMAALAACAVATGATSAPERGSDREATRAIFARVIAYPTVIGRGEVPKMAAYLVGEFRRAGWADADVTVIPYDSGNADGSGVDKTAALIVRWHAATVATTSHHGHGP